MSNTCGRRSAVTMSLSMHLFFGEMNQLYLWQEQANFRPFQVSFAAISHQQRRNVTRRGYVEVIPNIRIVRAPAFDTGFKLFSAKFINCIY